ncbi:MAG: hypothetical protein IKY63_00035 [Tidjanibacter sp.]|nr:hypothetical protein [Tidjanibacter sp.]
MKRFFTISLSVLLFCFGVASDAYGQSKRTSTQQKKELTPVDIKSKRTRPVPVDDTTGYALTGDVVLYHNGAVITCDSMVRYNERQMSCFGNVIINKDDTFIYGDRAEYSRDEGEARVYSPLVKVLNGDATLYTYNLVFNTADNVGRFYGGATFTNGVNTMESERGYFYADLDEVVGVDRVEMKNETYEMKSDSVNYNTETEIARYFTRSTTWKTDGEILSSEDGEYHNKEQRYIFRHNAYIMSDQKEMWADTVDYHELVQFIELKHNAQIRDEEYKSIVFGNYGNYSHTTGDTFLTDDPAYVSFGDGDGDGLNDTVYMRSDSMYVYLVDSLGYCTLTRPDSATLAAEQAAKVKAMRDKAVADSLAIVKAERERFVADSLAQVAQREREELIDSLTTLRASYRAMEQSDSVEMMASRLDFVIDSLQNPPVDSTAMTAMVDSLVGAGSAVALDSLMMPTDSLAGDTTAKKSSADRIMLGLHNVKLFRKDFQGICDSLLMFSADSTSQLHKKSVMWNEINQITSERADVYTRNQKPHRVFFSEGKPIMSSEIDAERYNQVAGKTIEAKFEDGVMYRTDIVGNAQTLYYMVDDADGALMGFLVAESADMTFFIEENTVDGIMYRGDPVYTIYPMDQIPADQPQRMPEFVWHADERPTAEIIMGNWIINPSEKMRYLAMKRPKFPITYSIQRQKESLIAGGRWADRTDDISEEAKDFVERVKDK